MSNYWLGLDIGGTKCAVILAKACPGIEILDKIRFDTHTELGFEQAWNHLCEGIDAILEKHQLTASLIQGIGISCGGPLDSKKGVILCPPNLPGWENVRLPEMLKEKYGVNAWIQNDANACALVEWKLGAGRGTQNMVFLTMGTGMGGGVIAEGKLLCGNTDMGGEVGHLRLSQEGPVGFGKAGSFEGWCSGGGIGRQAIAMTETLLAQGKTPAWIADGHTPEELTCKLMADYAKKGDADALELFRRAGTMLGKGLALIADTLNPETIVIGSVFVRCEDLLRPSMKEALKAEAIPFSLEGLKVVPAQTGEAIGDLASVMVALYASGTDLNAGEPEKNPQVLQHYRLLFERYPALESCREQIMNAYLLLRDCYLRGGKLMLVGNGGSCADCGHIAGELMKGFWLRRPLPEALKAKIREATAPFGDGAENALQQGLPAIDLTAHTALNTAFANDCDPMLTAAQQVLALGREEDVVLGISTSGNSKNVILTLAVAKGLGLRTIGLTGQKGGKMLSLCDCTVTVPAMETAFVQEYHLPVYHALCSMLESRFFEA